MKYTIFFKPARQAIVLSMALATLGPTNAANAAGVEEQRAPSNLVQLSDGDSRINNAGKLRMLSQRMAAAACNVHADVAPDTSAQVLASAVEDFHKILNALEYGDQSLAIEGAEEREQTLRHIAEVHAAFDPMEAALTEQIGTGLTDALVQTLADENMALLESAKDLVVEVSGQYANPVALLQTDVMTIDIAGRQRMLTQKISKEVCLILSGINADAAQDALGGTISMFEVSLDALRNGMDQVGIAPPKTEEIAQGLATVQAHWDGVRPLLAAIGAGDDVTDDERKIVFSALNDTLREMNATVGLYAEASKLNM